MNLNGKAAIVTGGAVRLGRAISLELAKAGAAVLCVYHSSDEEANSLRDEIITAEGTCEIMQADIREKDAPKKIREACLKLFSRIDILVNNAALFYPTPIGEATETDWHTFHELNSKAAFFMSQEMGAWMKKNGNGRIVNIGDTNFRSPWPDYIPYTMTKAAVNSMTIGLAKALAPEVLVNCVNPGPVLLPEDYDKKQRERAVKATLLQREGSAEDIAQTVRFLCESDYITGAEIPVDGGRHIR